MRGRCGRELLECFHGKEPERRGRRARGRGSSGLSLVVWPLAWGEEGSWRVAWNVCAQGGGGVWPWVGRFACEGHTPGQILYHP